jgi:transmembrane sensor
MIDMEHPNFEEAAEWATRLAEYPEDRELAAQVEAWVAADPRRRGALLRSQAILSLACDAANGIERSSPAPRRLDRRWLLAGGAGLAASVAGLGVFAEFGRWRRFDTAFGEVRNAPLADGSLAAINADSRVDVRLADDERQVRITRGEAWFKVAHDPRRPFVVSAGPVRVRAVGTAFSVRRQDDAAQILVTEGVVEVWLDGKENQKIRVSAGSSARVGPTQPVQVVLAEQEVESALAWREGQVALYNVSLAEAAAQFNRYNARKLVIDDPGLARETLVGHFSANDPEGFAAAAAATLNARVVADETSIHLIR